MKKLLYSLVVFSVLLLIGCQENSITDPAREDLQKTDPQLVHQGTILLKGDLADPRESFGIKHLTIFGAVKFEHRFEYTDAIPPAPQQYVSLHLSVNAEIQDRNSPLDIIWSLSGDSKDIIYVSDNNDSNNILYKYYTVRGSNVGMRLVCRFLVTANGVDLGDFWLQLQNTDGSYPDITVE
jgi:hypothetical protein